MGFWEWGRLHHNQPYISGGDDDDYAGIALGVVGPRTGYVEDDTVANTATHATREAAASRINYEERSGGASDR